MTNRGVDGRRWAVCLLLMMLTSACSGSPGSPTPSPTPTPATSPTPGGGTSTPPQIPPVTNSSSALVAVGDSFAIVHSEGARFGYGVRFLLRETGGSSGATITRVVVYGPSGSDETGPGCWRDTLRVPPLGSLDTFYTEEGANWLLYCGPGSGGSTATPSLYVIVTFTDDFGITGSIGFPIKSLR